jgi:hypothetical protein
MILNQNGSLLESAMLPISILENVNDRILLGLGFYQVLESLLGSDTMGALTLHLFVLRVMGWPHFVFPPSATPDIRPDMDGAISFWTRLFPSPTSQLHLCCPRQGPWLPQRP